MKTIPQRELRNRISGVLRQVAAGERIRVTTNGQPVADLVPVKDARRRFVSKDELLELLRRVPLDPDFQRDLEVVNSTIDEI